MKEKRGLQNIVTIRLWKKSAEGRPDQVINSAVERGVPFWDLREEKEGQWRLSTSAAQTRPCLRLARRNGCGTKIIEKKGPGFFLGKLARRKSLVFAGLFFFFALSYASRFIWFVDIQCDNPQLALTVKSQLAAGGVMPGSLKTAAGADYIRLLLKGNSDVTWVGVEFQGSRLTLEVVERQDQSDTSMAGGFDLVAREAGEITEILVLQGEARVKPGDMAQKGQVLIAGYDPARQSSAGEAGPESEAEDSGLAGGSGQKGTGGRGDGENSGSESVAVENTGGQTPEAQAAEAQTAEGKPPQRQERARGLVRAKVSRRITASCPFLEETRQDTGEKVTWYRLVMEDDAAGKSRVWRLNGLNQEPFGQYRQVTSARVLWQSKDGDKRLKLLSTTHLEQESGYIERSLEEAAEYCRELAYEELAKAAGQDYRVMNEEVESAEDDGSGVIRLVLKVDTIELIAGAY